jgi:hypothetical protein
MNGYPSLDSPTNCANCGHPFQMSADGTHYEAWRSPDGKFFLQNSAPRAQSVIEPERAATNFAQRCLAAEQWAARCGTSSCHGLAGAGTLTGSAGCGSRLGTVRGTAGLGIVSGTSIGCEPG